MNNSTPPPYAPNTVNQTVDYGGITWKGQPGGQWTAQTSTGGGAVPGQAPNTQDIVNNAKALNQFQIQQNQPIISALGTQQAGLDQKYKDLVSSIKGNQQLDTNRQTLATNNELGRRGISSDSGLYQQDLTNALTPIDTQYSGLLANASAGSISDAQNLALQIAQLQAGNPESSISGALNYGGLVNQANQLQSSNANNSAQLALQQQQLQSQLSQQAIDNAYRQTAYNDSLKKTSGGGGNALDYLNGGNTTTQPYQSAWIVGNNTNGGGGNDWSYLQ